MTLLHVVKNVKRKNIKNKVFFVVLLENIRVAGARAHFMRLYILFDSIQFNSIHFYSIQRDENYETLRMKTK